MSNMSKRGLTFLRDERTLHAGGQSDGPVHLNELHLRTVPLTLLQLGDGHRGPSVFMHLSERGRSLDHLKIFHVFIQSWELRLKRRLPGTVISNSLRGILKSDMSAASQDKYLVLSDLYQPVKGTFS